MSTTEPKPLCERIGRRVRELRKDNGWTLKNLAERLEMSAPGLCDIENGQCEPMAGTLLRLSRVLGVTVDELLADEDYRLADAVEAKVMTKTTQMSPEFHGAANKDSDY